MAALVLAGCSGGQGPAIGPGPLAADVEPGRSWQCVPADPAGQYAIGAQPSWTPTEVEPARWARAVPLDGGGHVPTDWTERGQRLAHELQAEVGDSFVVVYDP